MAPLLFPVALKGPEEEGSGVKLEREGGCQAMAICSTVSVHWENAQEWAAETIPNNKQDKMGEKTASKTYG